MYNRLPPHFATGFKVADVALVMITEFGAFDCIISQRNLAAWQNVVIVVRQMRKDHGQLL